MKVLVIKTSSMGDVIHALPAVADAIAHGHQIDWVVEEAFADLPRLHPGMNKVIPFAWRRWRKNLARDHGELNQMLSELRSEQYDVVLDSQGLIKSAAVALFCRGERHGYSHTSAREPWASFAYQSRHAIRKGQHAIDRQRQLFAAALNYVVADDMPDFVKADQASAVEEVSGGTQRVMLLHGTTWPSKHWPDEMWQTMAQTIVSEGFEVVVTAGPSDEVELARAMRIAQLDGVVFAENKSLAELAQILLDSRLVIGVDSGLCHLAAVLGRPTLGLFGSTDAHLTGPRGVRARHLQSGFACSPCIEETCGYRGEPQLWQGKSVLPPCFAELSPEVVWTRAKNIMEQG